MATVKSNRQNYFPPISPSPTSAEIALHLKNLYTLGNDHDSAIDLVNQKVGSNTSAIASNANSINSGATVTKTIVINQFSGLGGVNDQTGQTAYTLQNTDNGIFLLLGDASPVTVTLNSAVTTPFFCFMTNYGSASVTLVPSSGAINQPTIPVGGLYIVGFTGIDWKASEILIPPQTFNAVTHKFLTSYDSATGIFSAAQPAYSDLTGTPTLPTTVTPVAGEYLTGYNAGTGAFSQSTPAGISVTITTAALTVGGTQGSQTFTGGILTAQVQAT